MKRSTGSSWGGWTRSSASPRQWPSRSAGRRLHGQGESSSATPSSFREELPDPEYRRQLLNFFPSPPRTVVGAAGRFSPEKGFGVLVDAATVVLRDHPDDGFVLFGDGPLRPALEQQIAKRGLQGKVILAGLPQRPGEVPAAPGPVRACRRSPRDCRSPCWRRWPRVCRWWRPRSAALPRPSRTASQAGSSRRVIRRRWPLVPSGSCCGTMPRPASVGCERPAARARTFHLWSPGGAVSSLIRAPGNIAATVSSLADRHIVS